MTLLHIKVCFDVTNEHKKTAYALDSLWGFIIKSSYWAALLIYAVTVACTGYTPKPRCFGGRDQGMAAPCAAETWLLQLLPVPTVKGKRDRGLDKHAA